MDFELARHNMIEQQIRTWDVLDPEVLALLRRIKREEYVLPVYQALAFADLELPLTGGKKMWQPKFEARVVQELAVKPGERVLEVGTGSGYLTALLAARALQVVSVEIDPELSAAAQKRLAQHSVNNASLVVGDAARGWKAGEPYDVIVFTASTPALPETALQDLRPGGRLFAVVGEAPVMTAQLIRRLADGGLRTQALFETCIEPLVNAVAPERFVF
ncbi:MAG: protein-L-isoaspartate O-methyltransferase [Betaproteobacteria bacterium]|nr:protein-L-isoaspartate O-methyltransferase [Betaproteobacteria bacterium]